MRFRKNNRPANPFFFFSCFVCLFSFVTFRFGKKIQGNNSSSTDLPTMYMCCLFLCLSSIEFFHLAATRLQLVSNKRKSQRQNYAIHQPTYSCARQFVRHPNRQNEQNQPVFPIFTSQHNMSMPGDIIMHTTMYLNLRKYYKDSHWISVEITKRMWTHQLHVNLSAQPTYVKVDSVGRWMMNLLFVQGLIY